MESSSEDSYQEKDEDKKSIRTSFLEDFSITSSSDEERPHLPTSKAKSSCSPVLQAAIKTSTPYLNTSRSTHVSWTTEFQDSQNKTEDQKSPSQSKEVQESRLINTKLDPGDATFDSDQEDPPGCTSASTVGPPSKANPFNFKPWTVKDIIRLLDGLKKLLPKVDNKGCLNTAKKIDWEQIAFDCFTAQDCKKEFEILLSNIKLVKSMTAVINELEEKIPSGKLKAFLILQPRQQFVRDFAEKNKGLVSGAELFAASAKAWKKLSPEEKEQYNKDYILAKEKEIACMSGDEPPQRPKIPFELYYEELCKKRGEKNLDLKATARERYKHMDPKKKIKYIALSAMELYTYELQAAKYLQKQPDWNLPTQRGPSKEDSDMYLRSLGMPPRPPNTASLLYYHQKLRTGELDNIHGTTRLFHAIEQFRRLPEHRQNKYRQKHREMLQEYTLEFENWRKKQNEVVRRLADKVLGKKQVLPSGILGRMQTHCREKEAARLSECKLDRTDAPCQEAERPCCRHLRDCEAEERLANSSCDKNYPPPDIQKLKKICKQEVFFSVDQPLEAKMEKIMLMVSGYDFLPVKARQRFDNAFKKWKYSLQAAIIVDVRHLEFYKRQEFLFKYRSVCKRFFKHDIFKTAFPIDKYPPCARSILS